MSFHADPTVQYRVPDPSEGEEAEFIITGGEGDVRVDGPTVVKVSTVGWGVSVRAGGDSVVVIDDGAACAVRLDDEAMLIDHDPDSTVKVDVTVDARDDSVVTTGHLGYIVSARDRAEVTMAVPTAETYLYGAGTRSVCHAHDHVWMSVSGMVRADAYGDGVRVMGDGAARVTRIPSPTADTDLELPDAPDLPPVGAVHVPEHMSTGKNGAPHRVRAHTRHR